MEIRLSNVIFVCILSICKSENHRIDQNLEKKLEITFKRNGNVGTLSPVAKLSIGSGWLELSTIIGTNTTMSPQTSFALPNGSMDGCDVWEVHKDYSIL